MKKIILIGLFISLNFCSSKPLLKEEKPIIAIRFHLVDEKKNPESLVLTSQKGENLYLYKEPFLTEKDIIKAKITDGIIRRYDILIEFNEEGSKKLSQVTRENINKKIAITIDGKIIMTPFVQSEIYGGKAMITGEKDENQTKKIVEKINQMIEQKKK